MKFIERETLKAKPADESKLGFGRLFTDYMYVQEYTDGAWQEGAILPHGPLSIDPASTVLHYGQEVFEGLKAYYGKDGQILLFRAKDNFARMNVSADRICLPAIDEAGAFEALNALVKKDAGWVPKKRGTSLYIRPNLFGNAARLGVDAADQVMFNIICSPSGAYYAHGLSPVKIYVEPRYVRAVRGGMGFAKTGGNYAASLKAGVDAHKTGYDQVLWLDGVERRYIEEVGAMNMFFLFKNELVTPALQGSILPGITRRSVLQLAEDLGVKAVERRIDIDEVVDGAKSGDLLEAFGSGTAAVISPVGEFFWKDEKLPVGDGNIGEFSQKLYDTLTGIQYGELPDPHGWVTVVE